MEKMTMLDYIKEAPIQAKENIKSYKELVSPLLQECEEKNIRTIWLIASGSSYNACYCARMFLCKLLSCEIKIVTPFTFVNYENNIVEDDLVLVITQSGLSTNAIEAIKKIKEMNVRAICLSGNTNSDIKDYADIVIDYGVKEELVGYVTKGVTTLTLFLMLFAIAYTKKEEYLKDIEKAISLNEEMIDKSLQFVQKHYKSFSSMNHIYFCGAGAHYGTALEGTLKAGETIHIPSCCYEVEEYIHGPNLQLTPDYTVVLFDGNDIASERVKQVYLATREASDKTYLLSNHPDVKDDENVISLSDSVCCECSPLAYLPFVQILSHCISNDLQSSKQHPLLKKFKKIASAKTDSFINYDGDD